MSTNIAMSHNLIVNLKQIALQLCTCTWIEIMTGAGLTLYLLLYLQSYNLAAITVAAFAPLIGFHFAIDRLFSKKNNGNKNTINNVSKWGPTVPSGRLLKIRSFAK